MATKSNKVTKPNVFKRKVGADEPMMVNRMERKYDILTENVTMRPEKNLFGIKNLDQINSMTEQDVNNMRKALRRLVEDYPIARAIAVSLATVLGTPVFHALASGDSDSKDADTIDEYFDKFGNDCLTGGRNNTLRDLTATVISEGYMICGDFFAIFDEVTGKLTAVHSEQVRSFQWQPVILTSYIDKETGKDIGPVKEVQGIIYKDEVPVAYRVFPMTVNGEVSTDATLSNDYPAKRVIHVSNTRGIGHYRGMPLLLSVAHLIMDLQRALDSKISKVVATIDMFGAIESEADSAYKLTREEMARVNNGKEKSDQIEVIASPTIKIGPNVFPRLAAGEKLKVVDDKYNGEDFKSVVTVAVNAISCAIGIPASVWFSKYEELNFSGSKAVGKDLQQTRDWFNEQLKEQLWKPLHRMVIGRANRREFIKISNKTDITDVEVRFSTKYVVDEAKEASSIAEQLKCGSKSLRDIIEERGEWYEDVMDERIRDGNALLDKLGVKDANRRMDMLINYVQEGRLTPEGAAPAPKPAAPPASQ